MPGSVAPGAAGRAAPRPGQGAQSSTHLLRHLGPVRRGTGRALRGGAGGRPGGSASCPTDGGVFEPPPRGGSPPAGPLRASGGGPEGARDVRHGDRPRRLARAEGGGRTWCGGFDPATTPRAGPGPGCPGRRRTSAAARRASAAPTPPCAIALRPRVPGAPPPRALSERLLPAEHPRDSPPFGRRAAEGGGRRRERGPIPGPTSHSTLSARLPPPRSRDGLQALVTVHAGKVPESASVLTLRPPSGGPPPPPRVARGPPAATSGGT